VIRQSTLARLLSRHLGDIKALPVNASGIAPTQRQRKLAVLAMLGAVVIYGTNFVISRHATLNGFTPYDLAALRFGGAGVLLFPLFMRAGGFSGCANVGWGRGVLLAIMSGAPMSLFQMTGLSLAPAAHGATIGPGIVSLMSVVGGAIIFGAILTNRAILGLGIVVAGLVCFGLASGFSGTRDIILGDISFLCMALVWGCYPLALQKWKVDALTATSVLSVLSLAYLPIFWLWLPSNLANIPLHIIVLHGFNQAVINMILGLWLWGWAARTIGASETGKFPPLIPVVGTLMAIPVLGEWPGQFQAIAIVLIVSGLLVMAFAPKGETVK
jgi:drug/metabolite transporter (DMT)-like permease